MKNTQGRPDRERDGRRGSQLVEAMLTMLPFFAMAFLVMDAAWGLFIKSTLQQAVREGVRYAVTGQPVASIKSTVQTQALGFLNSQAAAATLSVHFLNPTTLADITANPGANQGGNIVEVEVTGFQFSPLAPLFISAASITFNVTAADVIEGSPGTPIS